MTFLSKTFKVTLNEPVKVSNPQEFRRLGSMYGVQVLTLSPCGFLLYAQTDEDVDLRDFTIFLSKLFHEDVEYVGQIEEQKIYEAQYD